LPYQSLWDDLLQKEMHRFGSAGLSGIEGLKVWKKESLPERFHLKQAAHLGQVIVLADSSWSIQFADNKTAIWKGAHGYDNQNPLMNGIFYAIGPSFKQGYESPILQNIDIYNLLCRILKIQPAENDGKMERIEEVLR
jgi:predicted AlkP superfamily pyrophosphatase or phosphodiesterase